MPTPPITGAGPPIHDDRVRRAIDRMKSLHDSDGGLLEIVALGPTTIPALSDILFAREPSGLFQVRCRAAEALAALKAFSTLAEFLRTRRELSDPVERLGEDAVVSAAARLVARLREPWVYKLLVELARCRPLQGVLAGLGSFFRAESVPIFVDALGEDELRLTAEAILRGFGPKARPALLAAARDLGEDARSQSDSHLRKRRSAIALLAEIGVSRSDWTSVCSLVDDEDPQISILACEAGMRVADDADRSRMETRLRTLHHKVCWIHRAQIDGLLRTLQTRLS